MDVTIPSLDALPFPTPFLDVTNLDAVLALPELDYAPGEAELVLLDVPHDIWRHAIERDRYRRWLTGAKHLADRGIIPGPSHRRFGDQYFAAYSAGFYDAEDLMDERVAMKRAHPSDPLVVFGLHLGEQVDFAALPDLPKGYPWYAITHQTSGLACNHPNMIGIILDPRPEQLATVLRLATFADHQGHDCIGIGGPTLDELRRYADELESFGLSAEYAYPLIEEALYPLDRSMAPLLSDTPVPSDDELWPTEGLDLFGMLSSLYSTTPRRWAVFILGENCD